MFAVKFHSITKTLMLRAMRSNFDKKQTNFDKKQTNHFWQVSELQTNCFNTKYLLIFFFN